jgi:hypothetical protein
VRPGKAIQKTIANESTIASSEEEVCEHEYCGSNEEHLLRREAVHALLIRDIPRVLFVPIDFAREALTLPQSLLRRRLDGGWSRHAINKRTQTSNLCESLL